MFREVWMIRGLDDQGVWMIRGLDDQGGVDYHGRCR